MRFHIQKELGNPHDESYVGEKNFQKGLHLYLKTTSTQMRKLQICGKHWKPYLKSLLEKS